MVPAKNLLACSWYSVVLVSKGQVHNSREECAVGTKSGAGLGNLAMRMAFTRQLWWSEQTFHSDMLAWLTSVAV